MKAILYIVSLSLALFANSADLATCKKCHPTIVQEFESSMHKKSSIYEDKIHKAVWDKHPLKNKNDYTCAKCHTPNTTDGQAHKEGITCLNCHTITSVEKHAKSNKNIYSEKDKTFYSAEKGREGEIVKHETTSSWWGNKTTVGSAYHDIDYTNESFYNGQMCMGCHSHRQNSHEFNVCSIEEDGAKDKETNCISCHMPKIDGTATTVRKSKQHAYHGFAGARVKPEMLSQYVELDVKKLANGFEVTVENKAPHDLMTHPLRVAQLRATLIRDSKHIELNTHTFVRVIGTDGKPSMPWLATEVVKDTMLKANEKRVINYGDVLKSGDKVEVSLGYYLVNPKAVENLNLQDEKELIKFTTLKIKHFNVE